MDELEDELTKALEATHDQEDNDPQSPISPPPTKRRRRTKVIHAMPPPDPLSRLSNQCVMNITSRLSPEDLCSLAQTSRHFRSVAAEPTLWRKLYFARWAGGPSEIEQQGEARLPESFSWKSMYIARDKTELDREAREAPECFRNIYLQMVTARRSEPLTAAQIAELGSSSGQARGQGVLSDRIAAFRRDRGLAKGTSALENESGGQHHIDGHTSDAVAPPCPGGCSFIELEPNYWICERGGHVHECGPEACKERRVDAGGEVLVCGITGRCFQPMVGDYEEGGPGDEGGTREGDEAGGGDWNTAEDGMGGRLGRAFFAGYNAADEREMLLRFGIKF